MVFSKRLNRLIGCETLPSRVVLMIVLPLMLERVLGIILGIIDTAVLSATDPLLIEATGLTATISTMFMYFPCAFCIGGAVLAAQYRGKDDYKGIRETMG